jgi:RND family efflux transporter MFP subunit
MTRLVLFILFLAFLVGCGRRTAPAVLQAASPPVKAQRSQPRAEAGFIGVVVAGDWAELEAKVEGRIEEVFVHPGDVVKKGAPIARLDAESTRHDLAGARAAFAEAARRLVRRRKLARGRLAAVTVEEVDAARREMLQERAHLAKLEQARAQALVAAPFDGTVAERYLSPGALAGPGRPIARLLGEGAPQVRFALPEDRAGEVTVGALVTVKLAPAGTLARARVTAVSPEVDASARMVFATAALEPQARPLRTGLLARVFVTAPAAGER